MTPNHFPTAKFRVFFTSQKITYLGNLRFLWTSALGAHQCNGSEGAVWGVFRGDGHRMTALIQRDLGWWQLTGCFLECSPRTLGGNSIQLWRRTRICFSNWVGEKNTNYRDVLGGRWEVFMSWGLKTRLYQAYKSRVWCFGALWCLSFCFPSPLF